MKNKAVPILFIPTALLLTLLALSQEHARNLPAPSASQSAALSVDEVLWWLPPDTETLLVAQGPIQLTAPSRPESDGRLLEKLLQVTTLGNLAATEGKEGRAFPKPLVGASIQFAVQGSRNFRAPRSLGGMPFDGCGIIVFADDFRKRGDNFLKYLDAQVQATKGEVAGLPSLSWEGKYEEDTWKFFLVRPRPNVLLVATEETYLRETLERMKGRDSVRAFPESLPEWKFIDRQARYWAIRHFRRGTEKSDPSSPFGGKKAANEPDEQAIGVAFSYSQSWGKPPTVYYLSDSPKAVEIARKMWFHPEEGLKASVRTTAPGVVEINVPLPSEQAAQMFLFVWVAVVGQGIYL